MSKHRAWLRDRLFVRRRYLEPKDYEAFTYKFIEKNYDEMFQEWISVEKTFESFERLKINGKRWIGFNCGDHGKIESVFGKRFKIIDERVAPKLGFKIKFKAKLRSEQQVIADFWLSNRRYGIVYAPVRWGKSFLSGYLFCKMGLRTLVLMDKIHLCKQWIKDLRKMTNIKKLEEKSGKEVIGLLKRRGKKYELYPITVSTFQTVWSAQKRRKFIDKNKCYFGLVWADEAHHTPAKTFAKATIGWYAKHKGGVSGTVVRRDNKHLLMHDIIGPVTAEGTVEQMACKIVKHMTDYYVNPKAIWVRMVSAVVGNEELNEDVARIVAKQARNGRFILVHTEREKHTYFLKEKIQEYDPHIVVEVLHGNVHVDERDRIIKAMDKGEVNVIIGARVMQEGITFKKADVLHFGFSPVTNPELIKQISGRIRTPLEGKPTPIIHDWRLKGHGGLYASGRRRDQYWEKMGWKVKVKYEMGDQSHSDDLLKDESKIPKLCGNCCNFFKCKSKDNVKAKSEICKLFKGHDMSNREKLEFILTNKETVGFTGWYAKFLNDLKEQQDLYWSKRQVAVLHRVFYDTLNNAEVRRWEN